jgi:hypothetical protein
MRRSQPLDMNNKELLKRLGYKDKTAEEEALSRQVVKVETVDEMFDFDWKPNLWWYLRWPFGKVKVWLKNRKSSRKHYSYFRKEFVEYYPFSILSFLPIFIRHMELYIKLEKKIGHSAPEWKDHKIATAQEAVDIMKRLVADDYDSVYLDPIKEKWGKFPYEKTTYADGSTGYHHLTPEEYDKETREAYEKAHVDEERDLKRLGELIEKNMLDWWD